MCVCVCVCVTLSTHADMADSEQDGRASEKRRRDKAELQTPNAIRERAVAERKRQRLNFKQSPEGCTPPVHIALCGHLSNYSQALIAKLRVYFSSLAPTDQRKFLAPGVRSTLDTDRVNKGGSMSNVKLHGNFRLERPEVLEDRLSEALRSGTHLPIPSLEDTQRMCCKDLCWAVGKCNGFFNQHNRDPQRASRSSDLTKEERVFQTEWVRREVNGRVSLKTTLVC